MDEKSCESRYHGLLHFGVLTLLLSSTTPFLLALAYDQYSRTNFHRCFAPDSEAGIATHYVSSHRIPALLERLSGMIEPSAEAINETLNEFHMDRMTEEATSTITGTRRTAIDLAFQKDTVEDVFSALRAMQDGDHPEAEWAGRTVEQLDLRSPTSLRITMENLQRGRNMTLGQALKMEMGIASAFSVSWHRSAD